MHLISWSEFTGALAVYREYGLPVWMVVAPFPLLVAMAGLMFFRLRIRQGALTLFWTAMLFIIVSRLDAVYVALVARPGA